MDCVILMRFVACLIGDESQDATYQTSQLKDIATDSLKLSTTELEQFRDMWRTFLSLEPLHHCVMYKSGMAMINIHRIQSGAEPIISFHQLNV